MKEVVNSNGGLVATVLLLMVSINIVLTAVKAVIEKWEPTEEQQKNSKVLHIITKVLGVTSNVIDWMTGNKEHK
jgi:divalent metal cation (Fe/Co/Zn/Cd) transporter